MTDLGARAAGLEREIAAANCELRAALLNGHDTSAVRDKLLALAAEASEVAQTMSAERLAFTRDLEARIHGDAAALASAATSRLHARLAALEPPPAPARA